MGMNITGDDKKLQEDADDLVNTADNKVQADRGTAGFVSVRASARASSARATTLDVRSHATGLPNGVGMNLAGGALSVQAQYRNMVSPRRK